MIPNDIAFQIAMSVGWPSLEYAMVEDGAKLKAAVKALAECAPDEVTARRIANKVLCIRPTCPTYAEVAAMFQIEVQNTPLGRSGCEACNNTGFLHCTVTHKARNGDETQYTAVEDCQCHQRRLKGEE